MSIESTFYDAVSGDAAVIALVGTNITAQVAKRNADPPYITYQVIFGTPYNVLKGAPEDGRKVIQVNCISKTYEEAKEISEAVIASINESIAYLTNEGDDYFNQTQNHRVRLDFALIG